MLFLLWPCLITQGFILKLLQQRSTGLFYPLVYGYGINLFSHRFGVMRQWDSI